MLKTSGVESQAGEQDRKEGWEQRRKPEDTQLGSRERETERAASAEAWLLFAC